ncbi:hypothetical protein YPPY76_3884, partial [Yersinia pestis PY-76]
MANSQARRI